MERARAEASSSGVEIYTRPSSSMSIFTPVSAMILFIILPPGPMTSRIFSGLMVKRVILGAYLAHMIARLGQAFEHLAQYEHARIVRLTQSLTQYRLVDALDLDVHLDRGDTFGGTGDLEVHIAQEVLNDPEYR